jgi:hypothetical protein
VQTGDHKAQRGGGVRRASVLIFFREVDKIIQIGVFLTNFFFFSLINERISRRCG